MAVENLKAGIAERAITPALGSKLAVEFGPQTAQGAATPLMAKALVLDNSQVRLALVTLDLYGLEPGAAGRVQRSAAQRLRIPPEAVMIVCSHTRGGPYTTGVVGEPMLDEAALRALESAIPDLVEEAQAGLRQASLGAGKVMVPHIVYNHRLLTRNMKAITAWMGVPRNEVLEPEGPVDPAFSVLVLRDSKGFPLGILWNFAADNRFPEDGKISAGLPHYVQQEVDARVGRHLPLFYLPGCGGNISFIHGIEASADAVASAVIAAYLETSTDPQILLKCQAETMILPVRDTTCLWSQPDIELKHPQALAAYGREIEIMQQHNGQAVETQVQVFRLGRYALVGLPGMPFSEFGLEIKKTSPAQETLVVANSGGHLGYVISRQAFENEGFESWPARSAMVGPGGGEFMAEEVERLVRSMWKG